MPAASTVPPAAATAVLVVVLSLAWAGKMTCANEGNFDDWSRFSKQTNYVFVYGHINKDT